MLDSIHQQIQQALKLNCNYYDAKGCTLLVQHFIVNQPPVVSASAPAMCNAGSSLITTTATGNGPFTFAWLLMQS